MSGDGSKIIITDGTDIWLSTNTGSLFSKTTMGTPSPDTGGAWEALGASSDGTVYYGGVVVNPTQSDLFSSSDAATWTSLTTGSPASGVGIFNNIAVSSDKTKIAFPTNATPNDVYVSSDSGSTWSGQTSGGGGSSFLAGSTTLETMLVGSTAGIPSEWVDYTINFGGSWAPAGQGTSSPDVAPLVAASGDGVTLTAVGAISGVATTFYSTDSGSTWTAVSGPTGIACDGLAAASAATAIYAADGGGSVGIMKSTNGGATWAATGAPTSKIYNDVACSSNGAVVCAVTQGQGVWISTDSGATWTETAI